MPLIKQALWNPRTHAIHRYRKMRRKGGINSKTSIEIFKEILWAMKEIDPDGRKAFEIAEELSKKGGKSPA